MVGLGEVNAPRAAIVLATAGLPGSLLNTPIPKRHNGTPARMDPETRAGCSFAATIALLWAWSALTALLALVAVVFDAVVPISPRWRRRIILIRGGLGSGYIERGVTGGDDEYRRVWCQSASSPCHQTHLYAKKKLSKIGKSNKKKRQLPQLT